MKLTKQGLKRNRGAKIVFYKENIDVNFGEDCIVIYASGQEMSETGRKTSETTHFYTLELTYKNFASIIDAIEIRDKKTKKLNSSFREVLLDKKEKLLQLLMLTSDFLDQDIEND